MHEDFHTQYRGSVRIQLCLPQADEEPNIAETQLRVFDKYISRLRSNLTDRDLDTIAISCHGYNQDAPLELLQGKDVAVDRNSLRNAGL